MGQRLVVVQRLLFIAMARSRHTWALWFVLLAIPGSGLLRFDGLPFSSKSEFIVFSVSACVLFLHEFRKRCRSLLSWRNGQCKRWVNTIFVAAIVLKFFTFVLAPLGNGFESCYRSVYSPPKQEVKCEKSFEAPFLKTYDNNDLDGITRVEPTLNFGSARSGPGSFNTAETTWRLPFVNEYPRFDAQWLDRFAFTAKFAAFVNANDDSFIPIQFVGEVSVSVGGSITSAESYEKASVILVPVKKGIQKFRIDFKFADLDVSEIPDRQPTIRGPWAELFVGKPIRPNRLVPALNLNVRGWSINQETKQAPFKIELRNQAGETIAFVKPFPRPDVAQAFGDDNYTLSGFDLAGVDVGITSDNKDFELFAIYSNETAIQIGKITHVLNKVDNLTKAEITATNPPDNPVSIDSAWFSIDTQKVAPLVAAQSKRSSLTIATLLLDLLVMLGFLLIFVISFAALKRNLSQVVKLIILCLTSNLIFTNLPFSWWGYKFVVIPIVIGILISYSLQRDRSLNLIAVLPGVLAIIVGPSINFARTLMGLADAPWWGFQLFRGRESDWFVTQGYARRIFLDASLNGGENLFYFQPATRYLVFIQHLLFGENDVLFGILMSIAALFAIVFAAREVLNRLYGSRWQYLIAIFIIGGFVTFVEQSFLGFAVAPSSEYTTWILIFLISGLIVRGNISQSMAIIATVMAALTAQFRPNQAFGALLLFLLIQSELVTTENSRQLLTRLQLSVVFVTTMSLSLMHNLYYGFEFVFFSVTGGINSNSSYSDFLNIFNDEAVRAMFVDKLSQTLNLRWPPNPVSLAFWSLQLIWLLAVANTIRLRSTAFKFWIALIFPLTYFLPQLPYDISSYYPRHVVATQLAFGLSGLYVISRQVRIKSRISRTIDGSYLNPLPNSTDAFQRAEI